jgi:hypothetical protein
MMERSEDLRRWARALFFLNISTTLRALGSAARSLIRSLRCSCVCLRCWREQIRSSRSHGFEPKKIELLRRLRPFTDGNAVAQPGDIFATLKPRAIAAMLRRLGVTSAQLDELHVGKPGRIG